MIFFLGHDSPFCTLDTGGCMKSLKGTNASLRAEQTSEDEQVIHSTNVGYRAITCAHVLSSTVTISKFMRFLEPFSLPQEY